MKPITPTLHGYLDYATVLVFLVAPALLDFGGLPAVLSRGLAAVHLAVTLISAFPWGLRPWLPFVIHGVIEKVVGPLLVLAPFILGFTSTGLAPHVFVVMGIGIIIVGWLTDYAASPDASLPGSH